VKTMRGSVLVGTSMVGVRVQVGTIVRVDIGRRSHDAPSARCSLRKGGLALINGYYPALSSAANEL
jgi:hypothetical protein